MEEYSHTPVMVQEVLEGLQICPNGIYWDGTFGRGGHSSRVLSLLSDSGALFASDRDVEAQASAVRFEADSRFTFFLGSLAEAVERVPDQISGFLWDLGVSTPQIKRADRGFSFSEDGPLDMRMDQSQGLTAADLVNSLSEKELADLIFNFGEERLSRRIARRIVESRGVGKIQTTGELEDICFKSYPHRNHHRIHPATRTFQALRIVVNDELTQIKETLPKALRKLKPGGRAVIMSFHSLEDRIIKHTFKAFAADGAFRILTKRPLRPSEEETRENPASRSSKLRIIEAISHE